MICLFLAQLVAPALPEVTPQAVITPPSMSVTLVWSQSATVGCSNRVYSWNSLISTNYTVTTNTVRVIQPIEPRTFHRVVAVRDGIEATNWNVIGVPPKEVDVVYAQRDGKDFGVVDVWTNPPALPSAQYRVRVHRTEDYSP